MIYYPPFFTGLASCAFSIFQKLSKCSLGLINDEKILALIMQGIRYLLRLKINL